MTPSVMNLQLGLTTEDGLWKVDSAVVVLNDPEERDSIINEVHHCGHLGTDATFKLLQSHSCWDHGDNTMRQRVEASVLSCNGCR